MLHVLCGAATKVLDLNCTFRATIVRMELPAFIAEIGNDAAAKLFKVQPRVVTSWRYKQRRPRPEKALEIERVTQGRVRFVDIYGEGA